MGEIIDGTIIGISVQGSIDFRAPYENWERFCVREYDKVRIELLDSRCASNQQKAKAHILMKEIAEYVGESKGRMELVLKRLFNNEARESLVKDDFSLASIDMTTAKEFITFLVSFCIEFEVPLSKPLYELCEDIEQYMYQCLKHKTCLICGRKADLHHCEGSTVGMGGNRETMIHEGLEAMPLCREHHDECHQHGQKAFNEKYHFDKGYILTAELCKIYGLKYNLT